MDGDEILNDQESVELGFDEDSAFEEVEHEDSAPDAEPEPDQPLQGESEMKTATKKKAAPKKKETAKKTIPAKKAPAAKKKAASKASKNGNGALGRKSSFAGMKLYKVPEVKFNSESRRSQSYASITNGMKFEKFVENGGSKVDLAIMVKDGKVEVRKD